MASCKPFNPDYTVGFRFEGRKRNGSKGFVEEHSLRYADERKASETLAAAVPRYSARSGGSRNPTGYQGSTSFRLVLLMKRRPREGSHGSGKANLCLCGQGRPHQ